MIKLYISTDLKIIWAPIIIDIIDIILFKINYNTKLAFNSITNDFFYHFYTKIIAYLFAMKYYI